MNDEVTKVKKGQDWTNWRNIKETKPLTQAAKQAIDLFSIGTSIVKIGEKLSVNPGTVSKWINCDAGKKFLQELLDKAGAGSLFEAAAYVRELVEKSLKIHMRVLDGDKNVTLKQIKVANLYAKDFSGLRAPVLMYTHHTGISADEFAEWRRKALEKTGNVIEGEVITEEQPATIN